MADVLYACALCGAPFSQWHALFACPALDTRARELELDLPAGTLQVARNSEADMLFHHLLVDDPGRALAPPTAEETLVWRVAPGYDALFAGLAFGDGSGIHGQSHVTRRCGFAVAGEIAIYAQDAVLCEGNVGARVLVHGPLPGPVQEVPLAELFALVIALRFGMPSNAGTFEFYTDCAWVVGSLAAGEQHCCASGSWGALMWREVFRLMRSLFGEVDCMSKLIVHKVKAHTSLASVADSPELTWRRGGNAIADSAAKLGACMHQLDAEVLEERKAKSEFVRMLGLYVGRLAKWRWDTYGKRAILDVDTSALASSDFAPAPRPLACSHKAVLDRGLRWRCIDCLQTANTVTKLCEAPCLDRANAVRSHRLAYAGHVLFCTRCGSWSDKRTRDLRISCLPPARPDRLRHLMGGRHPLHRYLLGKVEVCKLRSEWAILAAALNDGSGSGSLSMPSASSSAVHEKAGAVLPFLALLG